MQAEARLNKEEQKRLQDSRLELGRRIGTLETSLAQAEQDRIDAFAQRAAAHQRFTAANADGLLSEAGLEWEGALDGVTAVLAAAREVATVLEDVASDEASRQRASSQVDDRALRGPGRSVRACRLGARPRGARLVDPTGQCPRCPASGARAADRTLATRP